MISIDDLNALIQCQFRLLAFREDHPEAFADDGVWREEGEERFCEIGGDPWSWCERRDDLAFTCRSSGWVVLLKRDQRSPFEFSTRGLYLFISSRRPDEPLNDLAVENWLIHQAARGRIERSVYGDGFWTIV